MRDLYNVLVKVRDAVAEEINRLADPPESEEQFLAQKTRLISWLRDLSILRVQAEYAIPTS